MILPSLLFIAVVSAYLTSKCWAMNESKLLRNRQVLYQTLILGVLFLYPGLATRIFTVFRCREIVGVNDGLVLEADFAIRCAQGEHLMAAFLAIGGMFFFVLGAPLAMLVWLFRSRKYLHNAGEPGSAHRKKHEHVKSALGGLYLQYVLFSSVCATFKHQTCLTPFFLLVLFLGIFFQIRTRYGRCFCAIGTLLLFYILVAADVLFFFPCF